MITRNILYILCGILVFFSGMIGYGILLNTGETDLKEELNLQGLSEVEDIRIRISRKKYYLDLFSGKTLLKRYKTVFGKNQSNIKKADDDFVTPIGVYKVCEIDTNYIFHKFIKINYPSAADAAECFKNGNITEQDFHLILNTSQSGCPSGETKLGSSIGIHGIGEFNLIFKNLPFVFNWTNGSAAVSNENIDEIIKFIKIGTTVEIVN